MRKSLPFSLAFFAATLAVFVLQTVPYIGLFLMLVAGMFWSVFLVNAGMIGVAAEALLGRVSRWWLVLPVLFYGGYWTIAALDHITLRSISAEYGNANSQVTIPFDATRQSLVFSDSHRGAWITQNYALPVAYTVNANFPEGYRSHRLMDATTCAKVRKTSGLNPASVQATGVYDGDTAYGRQSDRRFCTLSMPEQPEHSAVRVSRHEEKRLEGLLPVRHITTAVTMSDGSRFELLNAVAKPLHWIPMPVLGCGLNSAKASWDCFAQFWRKRSTSIRNRSQRNADVLPRALGLSPVAIADRKSGNASLILAKIAALQDATLTRQLANIDAMIANPVAKVHDWRVDAVANRPDVLSLRADALATGLERATAISENRDAARQSGWILAKLLARLPHQEFVGLGSRFLALYAKTDEKHWLWQAKPLLGRLGDLGTAALPYLVNPRMLALKGNIAEIEALCRVGPAGRPVAEPALIRMWTNSRDVFDRDARAALFVAMRRIGISPPPLVEDKRDQIASLQVEWADISPQSPSRVCAVETERQARREAKFNSKHRPNLN